ncbi:hypothetical protein MRX96_047863 [Rhipicephalus microplus]
MSNSVEGGAEDKIKAMKGAEWQAVQPESAKERQAAESGLSQPNTSGCFQDSSSKVGVQSSRWAAALNKRVIVASRMRELPSTYWTVIIRCRDGLDDVKPAATASSPPSSRRLGSSPFKPAPIWSAPTS